MNEKEIRNFIVNELSNLEFKQCTKGFKYLCEAIYICIDDINALDNICKNVYPKIAFKYSEKSYLNVKWCIEQVITTMYNNTDMKVLCDFFKINENLKPSTKYIIYTIVSKYYWNIENNKNIVNI